MSVNIKATATGGAIQVNGVDAVTFDVNGLATGGGVIPVGSIITWITSTPPTGYIECNGDPISRTTYAALFAVLGTDYGVGDGSTTFNLPDFRGEFLRGWDNTKGSDPDAASRTDRGDGTTGDVVGSKQPSENLSHGHSIRGTNAAGTTGTSSYLGAINVTGSFNSTATLSGVDNGGNESRPRNVNVMYCIRA